MKMPWKDPGNWQWLTKAEFMSPLLAFATAFLRAAYDEDEPAWLKILLESAVCALIAIGVGALLAELGFSSGNARIAAASVVGLYGVDYVRHIGNNLANRKLGK